MGSAQVWGNVRPFQGGATAKQAYLGRGRGKRVAQVTSPVPTRDGSGCVPAPPPPSALQAWAQPPHGHAGAFGPLASQPLPPPGVGALGLYPCVEGPLFGDFARRLYRQWQACWAKDPLPWSMAHTSLRSASWCGPAKCLTLPLDQHCPSPRQPPRFLQVGRMDLRAARSP